MVFHAVRPGHKCGIKYWLLYNMDKEIEIMENKDECPKCHSKWVNDIGFDTMQCFNCDHTWKQKSKTGLENNHQKLK